MSTVLGLGQSEGSIFLPPMLKLIKEIFFLRTKQNDFDNVSSMGTESQSGGSILVA